MLTEPNNPPNLTSIAYRLGTHPTFRRRMLSRLSTQIVPPDETGSNGAKRPLAALTTRDPDDPAIALLDAWAMVADVLAFYQERIANQGYLHTARELRSTVELARMVGYERRPGLAATVPLAFTVEPPPGSSRIVSLQVGLRVQSLPGQDLLPEVFETVEALEARPEWNQLRPYVPHISVPQVVDSNSRSLHLAGLSTGLQPGDRLLLANSETGDPYTMVTLQTVSPDTAQGCTYVGWNMQTDFADRVNDGQALTDPTVYAWRQRAMLFGHNAPLWDDIPAARKQVAGGVFRLSGADVIHLQPGLPHWPVQGLAAYRHGQVDYLFAATAGGGVFRSIDDGANWTPANSGLSNLVLHALDIDAQGGLLAGSTEGVIFRSIDNGETWSRLSAGVLVERTPGDGDEAPDVHQLVNNGLPITAIRALATVDIQRHIRRILAGTDSGLYRSDNDGTSWIRVDTLPTQLIRALVVVPGNGNHPTILAGVRNGLYRSTNNGVTWTEVASLEGRTVQSLAVATGDVEGTHVILAGTEVGLYRSTDDGASWLPAPPAALPSDDIRALAINAEGQTVVAIPLGAFIHSDWPGFAFQSHQIDLDTQYPRILADSWVALINRDQVAAHRVTTVSTVVRQDFNQTGRITRLALDTEPAPEVFGNSRLRETEVWVQSERLALFSTTERDDAPVQDDEITLDRDVPKPAVGQRIIVRGQRDGGNANTPDDIRSEVGVVRGVGYDDGGRTVITLQHPLENTYAWDTVTIHANVVLATHGATVADEVLGNGNGAQSNQRFRLRQSPLTYVPAPTDSGARSTLEVRVNGILWDEASSLHALDRNRKAYIVRQDDKGQSHLIFGNGRQGARLPTGVENVIATYRSGIGLGGEIEASTATLLQTRPLGVQEVTNPVPASGAADPDSVERIRLNAPSTLRTMGRLVARTDFEDFAQAFSGIGRAQATIVWTGESRVLHLTLADRQGDPVRTDSGLYQSLVEAIDARRHRSQAVQVDPYERLLFNVEANVYADPRHDTDEIERHIRALLDDAFAFRNRRFAQPVAASDLTSLIQRVEGVVAVDIDTLYLSGTDPVRHPSLAAQPARHSGGAIRPAQLLLINAQDEDELRLRLTRP